MGIGRTGVGRYRLAGYRPAPAAGYTYSFLTLLRSTGYIMPKAGELKAGVPNPESLPEAYRRQEAALAARKAAWVLARGKTAAPTANPPPTATAFPTLASALLELGKERAAEFCRINDIPEPAVHEIPAARWHFGDVCAFYRPDTDAVRGWLNGGEGREWHLYGPGINICVHHCGRACGEAESRNWSWPGSTTDRTPYGVVCHELGHHCDWLAGERKGEYFSDYCEAVMAASGEPPLTTYAATNPAEWLAEAMRLFITNHDLLRAVRPRTHAELLKRWKPVNPDMGWLPALGSNAPARVVRTNRTKGAK